MTTSQEQWWTFPYMGSPLLHKDYWKLTQIEICEIKRKYEIVHLTREMEIIKYKTLLTKANKTEHILQFSLEQDKQWQQDLSCSKP